MKNLLAKTGALFVLGFFLSVGFLNSHNTPLVAGITGSTAEGSYPYLSITTKSPLVSYTAPTSEQAAPIIETMTTAQIEQRFAGVLSHVRWLMNNKDADTLIRQQIYAVMDDVSEDMDDLEDRLSENDTSSLSELTTNLTLGSYYLSGDGDSEGIRINSTGGVQLTAALLDTSGDAGTNGQLLLSTGAGTNWVSTSTLGISGALSNNSIIPDYVLSTSQTDEYCLTYETTGDTWEWQTCGTGSGLLSTDIDTSAELAAILGDETGTGAVVLAGSPVFTGTITGANANFSGNVGIGTTTATAPFEIYGSGALAKIGNVGSAIHADTYISFLPGISSFVDGRAFVGYDATAFNSAGGLVLQSAGGKGIEFNAGDSVFGTGTDAVITAAGNFGIGTTTPTSRFYVHGTAAENATIVSVGPAVNDDPDGWLDWSSAEFRQRNNPTSRPSALTGFAQVDIPGLWAVGVGAAAHGENNSGTLSLLRAMFAEAEYSGLGTVTSSAGGEFLAYNYDAGTVVNNMGLSVGTGNDSNGVITNNYGLFVNSAHNDSGTVSNNYGVYVQDQSAVGSANSFNIYSVGASSKNYFAGNVGIGTTSPYAKLSVTGDIALTGGLYDSGASRGSNGMVLLSTGTGVDWVATSTLGIASGSSFSNSAQLRALLSDETGTGNAVFSASPTLSGTLSAANANFSGNIGIGTTTPNQRLVVEGSINISSATGALYFNDARFLYASSTNHSLTFGEYAGEGFSGVDQYNVALGYYAGRLATNNFNNFIGAYAGYSSDGTHNYLLGYNAGYNNSGNVNFIAGPDAGYNNIGSNNIIFGDDAGYNNNGNENFMAGSFAGYNSDGDYNFFTGYNAGRYIQGDANIALGAEALLGSHATNYLSSNNIALGYRAGYASDDGSGNNILIGYQAADNLTTGNNNIIIGHDIDNVSATADNRLNIGNLIFGTGLDGTGTTLSGGNVGIGTSSPYAKLSVAGNSAFTGQLNLAGSSANIALGSNWLSGDGDDEGIFVSSTGNVGIGTSTSLARLQIGGGSSFLSYRDDPSYFVPNGGIPDFFNSYSLYNKVTKTYGGITDDEYAGIFNVIDITTTQNDDESVYGSYNRVSLASPHSFLAVTAGANYVYSEGGGSLTYANGVTSGIYASNPGTVISSAYGEYLDIEAYNNGSITNAYGTYIYGYSETGSPITNFYGAYLYLDDLTNSSNVYGVYQTGVNARNYFAGNLGIASSSPSAKLTIQNTSIEKSFIVEDQADDASPFVIDASGNVGIGISTPSAKLHVSDNADVTQLIIDNHADASAWHGAGVDVQVYNVNGTNQAAGWYALTALRGTKSSPSALQSGDDIGGYFFQGSAGNTVGAIATGAYIYSEAKGNWTSSSTPADMTFWTTPSSSAAPLNRLTIQSSGNIGIGDTTPASLLTVGTADAFQVNNSGQVLAGTWQGTAVGTIYGGTGFTTYATGDMIYASAANTLSKRTIGTAGQILSVSGGVPTWVSTSTLNLAANAIALDTLDFAQFKDALTLDVSTDISITGSNVFSLTNTGTGNSFLVNDASGDTTPFTISASGNVGIGTSTPLAKLQIGSYFNSAYGASVPGGQNSLTLFNLNSTNNYNSAIDSRLRIDSASAGTNQVAVYGESNIVNSFAYSTLTAADFEIYKEGSGTLTNANLVSTYYGNYGGVGTTTNLSAFYVNGMDGLIENNYGLNVSNQTKGMNIYNIYTNQTAGTNKYALYNAGSAKSYFAGNVGIGTTSPSAKLQVEAVDTVVSSGNSFYVDTTISPSSNLTSGMDKAGVYSYIRSGNTNTLQRLTALSGYAESTLAQTIAALRGASAVSYNSQATVSNLIGSYNYTGTGGGTVGVQAGLISDYDATGGSITSAYGLWIRGTHSGATVANRYGIRIDAPTGSATNDYGFYQAGTQKNYFAGNVGIGTTSPYGLLSIERASGGQTGSVINAPNLVISDTSNGSSWDTTNPFAQLDFNSSDGTSASIGTRARIGAVMETTNGGNTRLGLFTAQSTAGALTERLSILHGGNVGIGSTSPASLLTLEKSGGAFTNGLLISGFDNDNASSYAINVTDENNAAISVFSVTSRGNNTAAADVYVSGNVGIGSTTPSAKLTVQNTGTGNSFVVEDQASDTSPFVVAADGKVGIGIAAPQRLLHVYGAGDSKALLEGTDGGAASLTFKNTQDEVGIGLGSDEKFHIGSDGSNPGGGTWFTITQSGLVGIGTTSPTYVLDVSGSGVNQARVSGTNTSYNILDMTAYGTGGAVQNMLRFNSGNTANWSVGVNQANGNALTFSSASLLTTGPRMVLTTAGNLGIGTSTPAAKLHVYSGASTLTASANYDDLIVEGGAGNLGLSFLSSGSSAIQAISFGRSGNVTKGALSYAHASNRLELEQGTNKVLITDNGVSLGGTDTTPDYKVEVVGLGTAPSGYFGISNAADGDVLTVNTSGNVGIGTNNPAQKLQIGSTTDAVANIVRVTTGASSSAVPMISLFRSGSSEAYIGYVNSGGQNVLALGADPAGYTTSGLLGGARLVFNNSNGFTGIGTSTPSQKLQVYGDIRVGTAGANGCLEDYGGGVIAGTCSSDERLKEDIQSIAQDGKSYLEKLTALTPVTYNWNETAADLYKKDQNVANLGLIAQDVEAQFPELISWNSDGYRQVDFRALPFYIIEAMKELWAKVQGHDERIENLEQENEYLKSRLNEIEDELNVTPPPAPEPTPEPAPEEGPAPEPTPEPSPEPPPEVPTEPAP